MAYITWNGEKLKNFSMGIHLQHCHSIQCLKSYINKAGE
jgi:hypothetical protein